MLSLPPDRPTHHPIAPHPTPARSYCGIRNNQKEVWRYTMPVEEVVEVAKWALENGIRNIMLQVGTTAFCVRPGGKAAPGEGGGRAGSRFLQCHGTIDRYPLRGPSLGTRRKPGLGFRTRHSIAPSHYPPPATVTRPNPSCAPTATTAPPPAPATPPQGGELKTEQRLAYLEACVRAIREETTQLDLEMRARAASTTTAEAAASAQADAEAKRGEPELGVVVSLSVGELPMEQYERLFRWAAAEQWGTGGWGGNMPELNEVRPNLSRKGCREGRRGGRRGRRRQEEVEEAGLGVRRQRIAHCG